MQVSFSPQELLTRPWSTSRVSAIWSALHQGCRLDVTKMVLEYALTA